MSLAPISKPTIKKWWFLHGFLPTVCMFYHISFWNYYWYYSTKCPYYTSILFLTIYTEHFYESTKLVSSYRNLKCIYLFVQTHVSQWCLSKKIKVIRMTRQRNNFGALVYCTIQWTKKKKEFMSIFLQIQVFVCIPLLPLQLWLHNLGMCLPS